MEIKEKSCVILRARDYPGTRRTRRRVVLYSELEIIQEHGEHGEELCYTQSQRLYRNTEKSCVILRARDYTGTLRTQRRVVSYSELEIIQEHGEHREELCYTQSQRLYRNTENTEKSCVILRARDYTGTGRTWRRVVLYSELEIIREHGEQGEELCYTQSQRLSRNRENTEKSCVILRARDYIGTRRTRRRVVLYLELEIIQEHGEQEEELCYTQRLLSIHFMKVVFVIFFKKRQ